MKSLKIKHIKNARRENIGTLVAFISTTGQLKFGISLCDKTDKFTRAIGTDTAIQNASANKPCPIVADERMGYVRYEVDNFIDACAHYYKQVTLGEFWTAINCTFGNLNKSK